MTDVAEVRIIGDKADSLQRVPGSGTVITQKQIDRANPNDVGEMLRRVPGVQVREEPGGGNRLDIGVRGLESGRSRRVLVLEDGIPVSLNPYAEPDMYYAPPIERMRGIEVVKGSGSILYGPQTLGGVVNFLTVAAPYHRIARVQLEGGQYGYLRGYARYGDRVGEARYVIQATGKRGEGFREQDFATGDLMGKLSFATSSKGTATVKLGLHGQSNDSEDVGLPRDVFRQNPRHPTLKPNDRLSLQRLEASLVHEQRLSNRAKLKTLLYAYTLSRVWGRQNYVRAPSPGIAYERSVGDPLLPGGGIWFENSNTVLDRSYQVAGIEPRLEQRITTGTVQHTLDLGARLLGEAAHYQQRSGDNVRSRSGSLDYEERHGTLAVASYAQDRIAFRDDLLLTPGVRVEHAAFTRRTLRHDDGSGVRDVDLRGTSSATGVIPGIGMVAGEKRAHVFAGLHLGWAPPRLTSSIGPRGVSTQLSPERSLNYEIGARLAPAKWWRAETTGFLSNYQNQVVLNTTPGAATSEIDGGKTRHVGVEASGTISFARLLQMGSDTELDLAARYTFSRATFLDGALGGNLLPYAPLHSFGSTLDVSRALWRHYVGGFQLAHHHVGQQYTDTNNTVAVDVTGRIGVLPAYDLVDANAHLLHRPSGLSLRLTVKNALDDVFVIARRPEGIFTSGYRLIYVALRWDYDRADPAAAR